MDKRKLSKSNFKSKYKPEISPADLIEIFSKGGGRETFCAKYKIPEQTFRLWLNHYPEFEDAYDVAKQVGKAYYMKLAKDNLIIDKEAPFNDRLWGQIMRCRHELSDHNRIRIPGIKNAQTTREKLECVAGHIAEGDLSSADIASLTKLLEACLKVSESAELEKRLEEIESKFALDSD